MIVSLDEIITTNNQFYYFKSHKVPFAFRQRAVEIVDIADVQDLEVWGERYCQITNKFAHVNKPFFFFCYLRLMNLHLSFQGRWFGGSSLRSWSSDVQSFRTHLILTENFFIHFLSNQRESHELPGCKQDNKYWITECDSDHRLFAIKHFIYVHSRLCISVSYFSNHK